MSVAVVAVPARQSVSAFPSTPPAKPPLPPVPSEYMLEAGRAERWVALGDVIGVDRFDAYIGGSWRRPPLVKAWQAKDYDSIVACIELTGSQVFGTSMYAGDLDNEGRSPAKRNGATKRKLRLVVDPSTESVTTTASSLSATLYPPSTCTSGPQPLPRGTVLVITLPTPTRGRCRGLSEEANKRWIEELRSCFSHPGQLAGRFISFVLAPWKLWGKPAIREIMAKMRKRLRKIAAEFRVRIIGKAAWKPNDYRPHWHYVIIIPFEYSVSQCAGLSDLLCARVDAVWRQENKQGLKEGSWKLKRSGSEVKNAVDYLARHETKEDIGAGWGLGTFRAGPEPEVQTEFWSVSARQYQRIWAALSVAAGGLRWHPWAANFRVVVEPRELLMIMRAVGIRVTPEQLERYGLDW